MNTKLPLKSNTIKNLWPQWIATFIVTLVTTQVGLIGGWSSPNLAKLTGENSQLPLTLHEASWVASIMNLGRVIGAVAGGTAAHIYGSKMSLLITCIPIALGWILIGIANSVWWLHIARNLGGFGMGMAFACFPLYIGEIANPSIRGTLVSIVICGAALGNFLASTIGAYFDLQMSSLMCLIPCIITILFFLWLPESPHHLVRLENPEKVKASLAWYDRGCDIDAAYYSLKKFVEISNSQNFREKLQEFRKPEMRKAMFIVLTLFMYMQMCGLNTITFFMEMILTSAQSTILKPSVTVIIMSFCACLASGISMYLIDAFGRRILLIVSCIGVAISLIMLEIHFILLDNGFDPITLGMLPIISVMIFQLNAFGGLMAVPSTVLSEIFPPAIKYLAACNASVVGAISAFVCSKTFQPLLDLLGQKYVYWIYVAIVLSAIPFTIFCMPETKGKSLEQIQDDITPKKQFNNNCHL